MGTLIFSLICGVLISLVMIFIIALIDDAINAKWWKGNVAMAAAVIVCMVISPTVGLYTSRQTSMEYVHEFAAEKAMIEESLSNEALSGFERAELVRLAADKNGNLAAKQYKASQWYGFNLSDEVLELEPISFSAE